MYEDRRSGFSFKGFFLTLLLVLLFIFVMLWLFPTKSYVDKKLQSQGDIETLSILYDEIFANNVERMKEAGVAYFTNERLPHLVGQSKKLTLQEMYDLHLVLKLKDKDGKACDVKKSYIEMTKYDEEYRMKVNLSCGDYEDYIIVYLGCYNYCKDGICEKRVSEKTTTSGGKVVDNYNGTVTPGKPTVTKTCVVENGKYYDKKGNVVNKTAYEKSCGKTTKKVCVVENGKYYDKNGKSVTKEAYEKSCYEPAKKVCVVENGKYYDKDGKVVSKEAYEKSCKTPEPKICVVIDGKYYGKNGTEVSEKVYKETCEETPVVKKYMYEYKLVIKGYSYWTEWSKWSKTVTKESSTREVESKSVAEISGYKTVKVKTGTKTSQVVTGTKKVKYQSGTTTELVPTTKKVQSGTEKVTSTEKVKVGETYTCGTKVYSGTTVPSDTSTTHYELIGSTTNPACGADCKATEKTLYTWYECGTKAVYDTKTVTKEVPVYKTVTEYQEKTVPVYSYKTVNVYETKTEDVYTTKTIPVYTTVTYYRYRDYITVPGSVDIKWSYSKYDTVLISKSYVLTGNVKEV